MTDGISEAGPTEDGDQAGTTVDEGAHIVRLGELASDPSFEPHLGRMIERGLASFDDPFKAVRTVLEMLERYCGAWDTGFILLGLLASPPPVDAEESPYAAIDDDEVRAQLAAAVVRLGGLYGQELQVGLDLSSRDGRDWQYIKTRTLYDLEAANWTVEVKIRQFNQDEIEIVGDPLSMLRLANNLVIMLAGLGLEAADFPSLMDDEAIDAFATVAPDLIAMLHGETVEGLDETAS